MKQTFPLPGGWSLEVTPDRGELFSFRVLNKHPETNKPRWFTIGMAKPHHKLPDQPMIDEVERPDGTIGVIIPTIAETPKGLYVLAVRKWRHGSPRKKFVEVERASWDNPNQPAPFEGAEIISLPGNKSNSARIKSETTGGLQIAKVALLRVNRLPQPPKGRFWMRLRRFMLETEDDGQGKAVIGMFLATRIP